MSHTFEIRPVDYKTRILVYTDGSHTLEASLEISGVREFDLVGSDTEFTRWTTPDEEIDVETRERIMARLQDWARENRLRIDIGPPMTREEFESMFSDADYEAMPQEDGSTLYQPRQTLSPSGWLTRLWGRLWGKDQSP